MTANENDRRRQESDGKSHQEQTQDGKKKDELNPNNPKANENPRQGSQNNQGSPAIMGETKPALKEEEVDDEKTTDKTVSQDRRK